MQKLSVRLTTTEKGFNIDQHAEACHKLMQILGYNEYGQSLPILVKLSNLNSSHSRRRFGFPSSSIRGLEIWL
jgi:hypothetical protein